MIQVTTQYRLNVSKKVRNRIKSNMNDMFMQDEKKEAEMKSKVDRTEICLKTWKTEIKYLLQK